MQNVFWTEGPSRTVRIGNQTVALKHVAPSKMIGAGTEAGVVIQAVRALGKEGVRDISIHSLAKPLPRPVKKAVRRRAGSPEVARRGTFRRRLAQGANGPGSQHCYEIKCRTRTPL